MFQARAFLFAFFKKTVIISSEEFEREMIMTNQKVPATPKTITPTVQSTRSASVDDTRTYLYETKTQNLSNQVFADDVVSGQEMVDIQLNHTEIIRDFLCACDLLDKMEKSPKQHTKEEMEAMRFIVEHLMRAREKSYAMMNKASFYRGIPKEEKLRRQMRRKNKEYLDINFSLYEIFALEGSAYDVIQYARRQEKARVMTPNEVQKTEKRIKDLVNQLVMNGSKGRSVMRFIKEGLNERQNV